MEYLKGVLNILCMLKGLPKWNDIPKDYNYIRDYIKNHIVRRFDNKYGRLLDVDY